MKSIIPRRAPKNSSCVLEQDKRLNIWSIATGRHVRGYKVEDPVLSATPVAGTGGAGGVAGVAGGGAGGGVRGGGGELFKVDLDPTGMYAAACSFDKVKVRCQNTFSPLFRGDPQQQQHYTFL